MDRVDEEDLIEPRHWDMRFIRDFMWLIGPVSSVFDFLTFYLLLHLFAAGEALFHTGWFVESIATQVLVIFIIRTRRNPWRSHPSGWLVVTSLAVVVAAAALPFTPIGWHLGFVPLPPLFFGILLLMVVCYLLAVELVKQKFYRRLAAKGKGSGGPLPAANRLVGHNAHQAFNSPS